MNTPNAGDIYCGPHHYFPALKNTALDIRGYISKSATERKNFIQQTTQHSLIVGGGGLLNRKAFRNQMILFNSLAQKGKKVVLWGVGHNEKDPDTFGKKIRYTPDISNIKITGTRDYSMPGKWVPCVSCLHPIFDNTFPITQKTGIVFHRSTLKNPKIVKQFEHLPSTSNTADFESLIQFIGNSEQIITSSYHVMYWSMLMKKKVVVIPNSSKFFDFKYAPVITTFDNALSALSKAQIYDGLLEECRTINLQFADKVFNYLGL